MFPKSTGFLLAEENCEITFITNNSEQADFVQNFVVGEQFGELPQLEKDGYLFDGWYTDLSYQTKVLPTSQVELSTSFYARWIAQDLYLSQHIFEIITNRLIECEQSGKVESLEFVNSQPTNYDYAFYVGATHKEGNVLDKYSSLKAYYKKLGNNFEVQVYGGQNVNLFLPADCSDLFNVENYSAHLKNLDLQLLKTNNVLHTNNMFKNLTALETINLLGFNQTFDIDLKASSNLVALTLPSEFSGNAVINIPQSSWIVLKNGTEHNFVGKNTSDVKGGLVCKKFGITIQNYGNGVEPQKMYYFANGENNEIQIDYIAQKEHYNFDSWNIKINTQNVLSKIEGNKIIIPKGAKGDLVISPNFLPIYHTVKFYSQDGSILLKEQTVQENTNAVYGGTLPKIEDDEVWHYEFDFWVTQPNGEQKANLSNIMQSSSVYAKYKKAINEYFVTVKLKEQNGETKTVDIFGGQSSFNGITLIPSSSEKTFEYGKSFNIKVETKYNYKILSVLVNGQEIKLKNNIIEINNINNNIEIKIEYKKMSFFATIPAIIIYSVIFVGIICIFILYLLKNKKIIIFNKKNNKK